MAWTLDRIIGSIGAASRVLGLGLLAITVPVVLVALTYAHERRAVAGPEVERVGASACITYAIASLGWTALWLVPSVWMLMRR